MGGMRSRKIRRQRRRQAFVESIVCFFSPLRPEHTASIVRCHKLIIIDHIRHSYITFQPCGYKWTCNRAPCKCSAVLFASGWPFRGYGVLSSFKRTSMEAAFHQGGLKVVSGASTLRAPFPHRIRAATLRTMEIPQHAIMVCNLPLGI